VTANIFPSPPIVVALVMKAVAVLTRATRRNIPEDGILHRLIFVVAPVAFEKRFVLFEFHNLREGLEDSSDRVSARRRPQPMPQYLRGRI
jgi:hypothetical protein